MALDPFFVGILLIAFVVLAVIMMAVQPTRA